MSPWILLAQNAGDAAAWMGGAMLLVWLVLALAGVAIWLWALIDAIQNPALDSTMRIVWVLVILFTSVLGAIIYLAIGRSMARRSPG